MEKRLAGTFIPLRHSKNWSQNWTPLTQNCAETRAECASHMTARELPNSPRASRREMSRQHPTFQLSVEDGRHRGHFLPPLSDLLSCSGMLVTPERLQDSGLTGTFSSPGPWSRWDLAHSWVVSDSGMPVILGCHSPHCTTSLFPLWLRRVRNDSLLQWH